MSSMQAADVREQLADLDAALAVLVELPGRRQQVAGRRELELRLGERQRLAVHLGELRLGVEGIDVRDAAVHEQEDDAPGPGREVRRPGGQRVGTARRFALAGTALGGEQAEEGHMAKAAGDAAQGCAA